MRILLPVLATLALALAACGGGNAQDDEAAADGATAGSSSTPTAATSGKGTGTEKALKDRAKAYFEAYRDEQPRASYEFYSKACRSQHSLADYTSAVVTGKAFLQAFLNLDMKELRLEEAKVTTFDGRAAVVVLVVADKDGKDPFEGLEDDPNEWAFEDGKWYLSDCDEMTIQQN